MRSRADTVSILTLSSFGAQFKFEFHRFDENTSPDVLEWRVRDDDDDFDCKVR